ncbi:MAG: hypothetical protein HY925_00715 [Elusimicrobia bacterium]|nr:hypothetical protein [Elusimicrobiota bacterium]
MSELYGLYQDPTGEGAFCGPVSIKTQQGLAAVAFPTTELAAYFASVFGVKGRVIKLAELGSPELPVRPRPPVKPPRLKLLFATKGVLSAWADDRQGFDTAPHVSPLGPRPAGS